MVDPNIEIQILIQGGEEWVGFDQNPHIFVLAGNIV